MTVRDLGYRPYDGARLAPSHNTSVLLRYGMRRAWGSWLVKIAIFLGWVPALLFMAFVGFLWATGQTSALEGARLVRSIFDWQLWMFVTLVTLGAGASAIAEDLTFKAFQFYFAKPVTPPQYLAGRAVAVAFWCFVLTFVPAAMVVLAVVGTAEESARLESVGLILPALVNALLIATTVSAASVAISSLSASRALTMSAWILLFIVPHAIAFVVFQISEWPWLLLVSIPALLGIVGDALFKIEPDSVLRWYHALPVLVALAGGSIALSLRRLRKAEVIT